MRTLSLAALSLTFLVGACAANPANEAANETGNGTAPAPPAEPSAPEQPANGERVTLTASPATTSGGSTMTLTLTNGAQQQIGYNLCTSALETSAGQPVPTSRACTMELRMLESGASAEYRYTLPVNMLEGSYRFTTQVEWMQSGRRGAIRSNSFEVRQD